MSADTKYIVYISRGKLDRAQWANHNGTSTWHLQQAGLFDLGRAKRNAACWIELGYANTQVIPVPPGVGLSKAVEDFFSGRQEPEGAPVQLLIDAAALLAPFVEDGQPIRRGEARDVLRRLREARVANAEAQPSHRDFLIPSDTNDVPAYAAAPTQAQPAPRECNLTECRGQPLCGKCIAMDRAIAATAPPQAQHKAPNSTATEDGARSQADAHLRALLRYTESFYGSAMAHGMKAGPTANAVAHVEGAAKALHALVHAWADVAESRAIQAQHKAEPVMRYGAVTVNGALICCELYDREPCPHNPAARCAGCPGNNHKAEAAPTQPMALTDERLELLVGNVVAATVAECESHDQDESDAEKDDAADRFIRARDTLLREVRMAITRGNE